MGVNMWADLEKHLCSTALGGAGTADTIAFRRDERRCFVSAGDERGHGGIWQGPTEASAHGSNLACVNWLHGRPTGRARECALKTRIKFQTRVTLRVEQGRLGLERWHESSVAYFTKTAEKAEAQVGGKITVLLMQRRDVERES
ncbi:hypothetical protein P4O66_010070 [Electrophorus voltai]|uniref:Uncharacterized protein n=1 Tax=Electrophorus voltai TaxID=2609070 RepID=A0AAD9DW08_9TELE|nr:hypothetical protein P4O66_010070 [Electrophorus voltai]